MQQRKVTTPMTSELTTILTATAPLIFIAMALIALVRDEDQWAWMFAGLALAAAGVVAITR